ncbi:MAG: ribosome hibernation-promoting factor, HPF/YfiA family [Acidimicrobiia bacterium]
MDVKMHGRNFQIEDRFRDMAASKISRAAKFFDGVGSADVEVTEEQNPRIADERFRVEITASATGNVVRVVGAASTPEAALDLSAERFGQQMKKLKGRLITRSRRAANKHLNDEALAVDEFSELDALDIVKVKQFVMKPMTPEEAALQMETLGHDFFFFQSADTDMPSVLYRRRDGAYGLIEPA